jgi:hypothetical protein
VFSRLTTQTIYGRKRCLLGCFHGIINCGCLLGLVLCNSIENQFIGEHVASIIRFLRVTEILSCITGKSLLIILSIEGCYLWVNNTVFWDALSAGKVTDPSGTYTLYL